MLRRTIPALLCAATLACAGTDVGNPPINGSDGNGGSGGLGGTGGTGGSGGGGGSGGAGGSGGVGGVGGYGGAGGSDVVVAVMPEAIDLGTTCPGGIARAWIELENHGGEPVEVSIDSGSPQLLLGESALTLVDTARVWLFANAAEAWAGSSRSGAVELSWSAGFFGATVPWTLEVAAEDFPRSQLTCGSHGPCEALDFSGAAGTAIEIPIQIFNDGCADLELTGLELDGDGPLPTVAGSDLPAIIEPAGTWVGTLRFEPDAAGSFAGELRILSVEDDPHPPVPWTAEITGADMSPPRAR